jgi:hypothetical protein
VPSSVLRQDQLREPEPTLARVPMLEPVLVLGPTSERVPEPVRFLPHPFLPHPFLPVPFSETRPFSEPNAFSEPRPFLEPQPVPVPELGPVALPAIPRRRVGGGRRDGPTAMRATDHWIR